MEILRRVQNGSVKLVQSSALEIELLQIPDVERRKRVQALLAIDSERVQAGTAEFARMELLTRLGVKPFDALHVACAESGRCDAFFTTDDRLLRKAQSIHPIISMHNPLRWLENEADQGEHI